MLRTKVCSRSTELPGATLRKMEIHIERAGEKFGPYSQAEARKYLANGDLMPGDMAWHKGMADWILLSSMFPGVSVPDGSSGSGAKPPRPSKKYHRLVIAGLVILAVAFLLSPYYALWKLKGAFESGEQERLEAQIDFSSVRAGLKEDMGAHLDRAAAKNQKGKDEPFGNLLGAIAKPLVESLIESMVTPSGLAELIADRKSPQGESTPTEPQSAPEAVELPKIGYAFFTSPTRFLVEVEGVKLRMSLSGSGWRVTRVEVPPELFESAMK